MPIYTYDFYILSKLGFNFAFKAAYAVKRLTKAFRLSPLLQKDL